MTVNDDSIHSGSTQYTGILYRLIQDPLGENNVTPCADYIL